MEGRDVAMVVAAGTQIASTAVSEIIKWVADLRSGDDAARKSAMENLLRVNETVTKVRSVEAASHARVIEEAVRGLPETRGVDDLIPLPGSSGG